MAESSETAGVKPERMELLPLLLEQVERRRNQRRSASCSTPTGRFLPLHRHSDGTLLLLSAFHHNLTPLHIKHPNPVTATFWLSIASHFILRSVRFDCLNEPYSICRLGVWGRKISVCVRSRTSCFIHFICSRVWFVGLAVNSVKRLLVVHWLHVLYLRKKRDRRTFEHSIIFRSSWR